MKKTFFSDKISEEAMAQIMVCFAPHFKNYIAGETILAYSDEPGQVGILLSGQAKLYYIDESGDTSLLETYSKGDLFGEAFSFPLENYEYIITAETDCRAIYMDQHHVFSPCEKSCPHHSQLITNLFLMTAQKSQALSLHISILSQHTTRKKLLAYLRHIQRSCNAKTGDIFVLPMSLGALAEYLCVDRTAMMREISAMKKDGLIDSDRRSFRLLK